MIKLIDALNHLDEILNQTAPEVANCLQPCLTRMDIDALIARFSWTLPQDIYELYQWHNGLARQLGKMSLVEKLLRQKDKWHGELSGRENELRLNYDNRPLFAKFLPLEYALAGHRHLKLGRCLLDLLPVFILNDGKSKLYCMMRLDVEQPTVYCVEGAKVLPMGIDERFLSMQDQFHNLTDLVLFVTACCEQMNIGNQNDRKVYEIGYELSSQQFNHIYQQFKAVI
jgi:hypothetical protein